jgi:transcriptional regulator with XRE-family HTH domain
MQKPAKRHVLANVRIECGLTQDQLAEILRRAKVSIQKVEQGQMSLSEELAEQIEKELDVSAAWLLENNPDSNPVTPRGGRWTKELFEFAQGARVAVVEVKPSGKWRARVRSGPHPLAGAKEEFAAWKVQDTAAKVHALIAGTEGSPSQGIMLHRLNTALKELMQRFRVDEAVLEQYKPQLSKLRAAYDRAEQKISEEEHDRMWREEQES